MIAEPISSRPGFAAINDEGYLSSILPPTAPDNARKTFCLDVGVNQGLVIFRDWLSVVPHMFAIGIEANRRLYSHHVFDNKLPQSVLDRSLILPLAVSSTRGTAIFSTGAGWDKNISDVGSLFGWSDAKREKLRKASTDHHQLVRLTPLKDILKYIHPPSPPLFLWDSFKIDIQGADVDGLISAEDYLSNFVCVIGEFQTTHYDVPNSIATDPIPILTKQNFRMIHDGINNQVYLLTFC